MFITAKNLGATSDMFQCGKCKKRECTFYQKQTRLAHPPPLPPVQSGHISSIPPYKVDTSRPSLRTNWTRLAPGRPRSSVRSSGSSSPPRASACAPSRSASSHRTASRPRPAPCAPALTGCCVCSRAPPPPVITSLVSLNAPLPRAPFQVQKIRLLLREHGLDSVRVGTVDDYQAPPPAHHPRALSLHPPFRAHPTRENPKRAGARGEGGAALHNALQRRAHRRGRRRLRRSGRPPSACGPGRACL